MCDRHGPPDASGEPADTSSALHSSVAPNGTQIKILSLVFCQLQVVVRIRGPEEEKLPSCIRSKAETGLVMVPPEGHRV